MTVHTADMRSDGVRLVAQSDSLSVVSRAGIGAVSGVAPLRVGGAASAGLGLLRWRSGEGLSWRAPGSATFGGVVTASANGDYLLEDGEDAGAFVVVRVASDYLSAGSAEAVLEVSAARRNQLAVDVDAATALAGGTDVRIFDVTNFTGHRVDSVKVWLQTAGNEALSTDGAAWSSPTTENTAIVIGSLESSASSPLHVRYTAGAGAAAVASLASRINASWVGE